MKIRYSFRAANAIEAIEIYYSEFSDDVCRNVINDIQSVTALLAEHPEIGRPHSSQLFRIITSSKYKFVITYNITNDAINILDVYRYQNRVTP